MVSRYWYLFYLSLFGTIFGITLFFLAHFFKKRVFFKRYGKISGVVLLIISSVLIIWFTMYCCDLFQRCCKDYVYIENNTYIEERARVIEFTVVKRDQDGNGEIRYREPKFFLIDKDEYVVLYVNDVEIGETYIIRYYPHTRICDVIQQIS